MPYKSATLPYLTGFPIKPQRVSTLGIVTFTDGVNSGITPNQEQCEAYGYTYDKATGTCSTFRFNTNLSRNIDNINNTLRGGQNTTETGTNNTLIMGENNTLRSLSRNNLIVGSQNEIISGISNATVLATNGEVRTQGEFAIGGGKQSIADSTDASTYVSRRKTSVIELAGVTIDNTSTKLTVQGDGSSFIPVKINSIIGYDLFITRLEVGGSSGTAGNYSYRNIRGAVRVLNSATMDFTVGFTRNIAKDGVNGTSAVAEATTGTDYSITVEVSDRNNVHNIWSASLTLHEIVTTTSLS
tara:strand:+ start:656 stop:1552 length:897 start_codon:yes stop_codon:yes gene_type:complete